MKAFSRLILSLRASGIPSSNKLTTNYLRDSPLEHYPYITIKKTSIKFYKIWAMRKTWITPLSVKNRLTKNLFMKTIFNLRSLVAAVMISQLWV